MKILVTGSEGFIGGYLVAELLRRGHHVVGLDNLTKYGPVRRAVHDHPRYDLHIGDARDGQLLHDLMLGCDHVIAGAARIGGIAYFHAIPFDLLVENEAITAATFTAAVDAHRRGRLQKVTLLSSSMVYESAEVWPTGEHDRMPPPRSSYGFQKLAAEYHARAAWQQHGLPYTIVRPFNCVGVGERRALGVPTVTSGGVELAMSHVVPDLVHKVLAGQDPLCIFGTGAQVRCYTAGEDLAAGIAIAVEHPAARCDVFNLSTQQQTSVGDLAAMIWEKVHGPGRPLRLHHDPPFEHDVQWRIPDTRKAERVLGWRATTRLDDMLDVVIPWVNQAMHAGEL